MSIFRFSEMSIFGIFDKSVIGFPPREVVIFRELLESQVLGEGLESVSRVVDIALLFFPKHNSGNLSMKF